MRLNLLKELQTTLESDQLLIILTILLPFTVLMIVFRSAWFKGALGEWLFKRRVRGNLPKEQYHLINDVTLPTKRGSTHIDHIIVSPFGIFVIETKNSKGWIFCSRRHGNKKDRVTCHNDAT